VLFFPAAFAVGCIQQPYDKSKNEDYLIKDRPGGSYVDNFLVDALKDVVVGFGNTNAEYVRVMTNMGSTSAQSIRIHGLWCGKGFPTESEMTIAALDIRVNSSKTGFDAYISKSMIPGGWLDYACATHDVCYMIDQQLMTAGKKSILAFCDLQLACDIRTLTPMFSTRELLDATKVIAWAGVGTTADFGDGRGYRNQCLDAPLSSVIDIKEKI
jgi:hypothetical protein